MRVSESRASLDYLLGNALLYSLTIGVLGTAGGLFLLPQALGHLGPGAADAARIAALAIPLVMLSEVVAGINLGLGRTHHYNAARVSSGIAVLAASIVLIVVGAATPETITAAGCLLGIVGLTAGAWGLPWRRVVLAIRGLRSDIAYGVRVFLTSVLALVNVRLDILLMSAFLSAGPIGFYSIANSAMLPIILVYASATTLILPSIARARGTGRGTSREEISFIRRTALRYTLLTVAVAALVAGALPVAIPLVFGRAFEPAVALAWILIPGFVAQGCGTIIDAGMVGMRTPWVGNLSQGAGVLVTALLLPFMLPAYQATGAAIVSSLAYTTTAGVAVWASSRLYRRASQVPRDLPAAMIRPMTPEPETVPPLTPS